MNPLFLIPVILVIVGVCFMVYMNKKHSAVKNDIDLDAERGNYDRYKQELLSQDFSHLAKWMKGKSIDAFTSGSIPQTTAGKLAKMASDGIENVALSAIGLKRNNLETECFWVLSGHDLHFFTTDSEGELEEHMVFDNFRIEAAKLQFAGILKSPAAVYLKSAEEYLPKVHVITFNLEGSAFALEIHDRLRYVVDPADMLNVKKQFLGRAKYQVVGEQFVDVLQSKFSNLAIA